MTMRIEILVDIEEVFSLLIFRRNSCLFRKDLAYSKIRVVTFYPPKRKFCPQTFSHVQNPSLSRLFPSSHANEEIGTFLTTSKSHKAIAMKVITAMNIAVTHVDSSFGARLNHAYSQSLRSYLHQTINIKVISLNISS